MFHVRTIFVFSHVRNRLTWSSDRLSRMHMKMIGDRKYSLARIPQKIKQNRNSYTIFTCQTFFDNIFIESKDTFREIIISFDIVSLSYTSIRWNINSIDSYFCPKFWQWFGVKKKTNSILILDGDSFFLMNKRWQAYSLSNKYKSCHKCHYSGSHYGRENERSGLRAWSVSQELSDTMPYIAKVKCRWDKCLNFRCAVPY